MFNNFTSINKMNNQLSPQLSEIIKKKKKKKKKKKTSTYDIGNPGPGLRQAKKCSRVKQVNGIPTLPF